MAIASQKSSIPPSPHTATQNTHGARVPHTIAHRGNDQRHPENSLEAVQGAVRAGCDGIEMDLRVSRDGVVVLAHDRTLERCFGVNKAVCDCDWAYLQTLQTLREPRCRMPRLADVLQYLAGQNVWLLLDIKLDNPPSIIPQISSTLAAVPSPIPWNARLTLGCWTAAFLPLLHDHLPGFPVALITFSLRYARQFLAVPNVGFNLNQKLLMGPLGRGFVDEARERGRAVYVWTVNEEDLVGWCLRARVDGVVTDCAAMVREKSAAWDGKQVGRIRLRLRAQAWMMSLAAVLFGWFFERKYLLPVKKAGFKQHVQYM